MSWLIAATAGSAVIGMQQAKKQAKMQEKQNMAQAAQTEFSPWSGMAGGQINTAPGQSGLEGAISGGLKGYMTANSLGLGAKPGVSESLIPTGSESIDPNDPLKKASLYGSGPYSNVFGVNKT